MEGGGIIRRNLKKHKRSDLALGIFCLTGRVSDPSLRKRENKTITLGAGKALSSFDFAALIF